MVSKKNREEMVKAIRRRAKAMLKLCENAEDGSLDYEELEKRVTKSLISMLGRGHGQAKGAHHHPPHHHKS